MKIEKELKNTEEMTEGFTQEQMASDEEEDINTLPSTGNAKSRYNRTAAGILALFLGSFGIHKFYQRKYVQGILCVLLSWTGVPAMLGLLEGALLLGTDKEESDGRA